MPKPAQTLLMLTESLSMKFSARSDRQVANWFAPQQPTDHPQIELIADDETPSELNNVLR